MDYYERVSIKLPYDCLRSEIPEHSNDSVVHPVRLFSTLSSILKPEKVILTTDGEGERLWVRKSHVTEDLDYLFDNGISS